MAQNGAKWPPALTGVCSQTFCRFSAARWRTNTLLAINFDLLEQKTQERWESERLGLLPRATASRAYTL